MTHLQIVKGELPGTGDLPLLIRHFDLALRAERKSSTTLDAYLKAARSVLEYLTSAGHSCNAVDVKADDLRAWIVELRKQPSGRKSGTLKETTVATYYRGAQQFFRFLVEEGEITHSPLDRIKPPKIDDEIPDVIPDSKLTRLFGTVEADKTFAGRRDIAILRLWLDSGIRSAEMAGITLEDLDLDLQVVRVLGKGRKYRDVPLGAKTAKAIASYLRHRARHGSAELSNLWLRADRTKGTTTSRGAMQSVGIAKMLERRALEAGVGHLHPHQFRHTFGHILKRQGISTPELKRLGGWSSDAMAERYGSTAETERAIQTHRRLSPGDQF